MRLSTKARLVAASFGATAMSSWSSVMSTALVVAAPGVIAYGISIHDWRTVGVGVLGLACVVIFLVVPTRSEYRERMRREQRRQAAASSRRTD